MAYTKIVFQNSPSTATPLNAENLNHMDDQIALNDQRLTELEGAHVSSFNGRTGAVTPTDGDYTADMIPYDEENSVGDILGNATSEIDGITVASASGESFALVPTSEGNALATHIFGMSTQNGTPTPSSPVDIDSAVANFTCANSDNTESVTITTDLTLRAIEVSSTDPYNLVRDGKYYVADTVDWSEDGGYVLTRRVGHREFDGSESWRVASGAPSGASLFGLDNFFDTNTTRKFLTKTNRFISINSYDDTNRNAPGYVSFAKSNNGIYLGVVDSIASTVSDFQTWLASNTTYVDYVLATPTTEPLTSEQAQSLLSLKTYDVSTSINAQSSPEPTVELEYAKSQTTALALSGHNVSRINALKIVDLNTALIELGGN